MAARKARKMMPGSGEWIHLYDKPIEMPWAYQSQRRFGDGPVPDEYYRHFKTRAEAEKSARAADRRSDWRGPVEFRPGKCWDGGYVF